MVGEAAADELGADRVLAGARRPRQYDQQPAGALQPSRDLRRFVELPHSSSRFIRRGPVVPRAENTRPVIVSGVIAASTMCPSSITSTAFVRRPLVMSTVMPRFFPSWIRRLVGAEFGATIAITRLMARTFPKPTWINSVAIAPLRPPSALYRRRTPPFGGGSASWREDGGRIAHHAITGTGRTGVSRRLRRGLRARCAAPAPGLSSGTSCSWTPPSHRRASCSSDRRPTAARRAARAPAGR